MICFPPSGGSLKAGKSRVLYGVSEEFPVVAVVGLGEQNQSYDPIEERDESREAIRTAVAGMIFIFLTCYQGNLEFKR